MLPAMCDIYRDCLEAQGFPRPWQSYGSQATLWFSQHQNLTLQHTCTLHTRNGVRHWSGHFCNEEFRPHTPKRRMWQQLLQFVSLSKQLLLARPGFKGFFVACHAPAQDSAPSSSKSLTTSKDDDHPTPSIPSTSFMLVLKRPVSQL